MSGRGSARDALTPRTRQWLKLGAGLMLVAALAGLLATAPDDRARSDAERRRMVANIPTGVDPRDLGIHGLCRRMNALGGELGKLGNSPEQLGLDAADSEGAEAHPFQTLCREREAELEELQRQLALLRDDVEAPAGPSPSQGATVTPPESPAEQADAAMPRGPHPCREHPAGRYPRRRIDT